VNELFCIWKYNKWSFEFAYTSFLSHAQGMNKEFDIQISIKLKCFVRVNVDIAVSCI